jgi:mannitol-1-/sugar-/sorbitol-6-/2-deoxyglucose-6-phosphatase
LSCAVVVPSPGRAAIFDMDGLLIDSEPLWHEAEVEVFGRLGVPLERAATRSTKGMFVDEVVAYWHDRYPWDGPSRDQVRDEILERVGQLVVERGRPLPGAADVVAALAERGPVALASSTPHALIEVVLGTLGLAEAFPIVCSAEDEAYGKPHPAVFLTAAERLGVDPERCCVFEDAPAGVLAAKAARMVCVAVPEAAERSNPHVLIADVVLESLEGFDPGLVDQLLEGR